MRSWKRRVCLMVVGGVALVPSGCGDNGSGSSSYVCSYQCSNSEVVHPAAQRYTAPSVEAAQEVCSADINNHCETGSPNCGCQKSSGT